MMFNAVQPEVVGPVLASILPGNWLHKDNNLLPKRSNTMTVQAAEAGVEPELEQVEHRLDTADHIQDKDMDKRMGMDKPSHKQRHLPPPLDRPSHLSNNNHDKHMTEMKKLIKLRELLSIKFS
jgi:hypothetical protein